MKNRLLTPSDLLETDEDSQGSLQERVTRLQSASRVLQQSIAAQQGVAKSVESQPDLYAVAIRVVEGLVDSYAQTLLQAALLDLQLLLGSELQVAMYLTQLAANARAQALQNRQQITENNGQLASGTSVAEPQLDKDQPDEEEPTVQDEELVN